MLMIIIIRFIRDAKFMINKIINSFRWKKAKGLWSQREFVKAASILSKTTFKGKYEAYVLTMRAGCYYYLNEFGKSSTYLNKAFDLIEKLEILGSINPDDARYLKCYIDYSRSIPSTYNIEKIELTKVSRSLKSTFPLDMHSQWKPDDYKAF